MPQRANSAQRGGSSAIWERIKTFEQIGSNVTSGNNSLMPASNSQIPLINPPSPPHHLPQDLLIDPHTNVRRIASVPARSLPSALKTLRDEQEYESDGEGNERRRRQKGVKFVESEEESTQEDGPCDVIDMGGEIRPNRGPKSRVRRVSVGRVLDTSEETETSEDENNGPGVAGCDRCVENEKLRKEIEVLKENNNEKDAKIEKLEAQCRRFILQANAMTTWRAEMIDMLDTVNSENVASRDLVRNLQMQLEAWKKECEDRDAALRKSNSELDRVRRTMGDLKVEAEARRQALIKMSAQGGNGEGGGATSSGASPVISEQQASKTPPGRRQRSATLSLGFNSKTPPKPDMSAFSPPSATVNSSGASSTPISTARPRSMLIPAPDSVSDASGDSNATSAVSWQTISDDATTNQNGQSNASSNQEPVEGTIIGKQNDSPGSPLAVNKPVQSVLQSESPRKGRLRGMSVTFGLKKGPPPPPGDIKPPEDVKTCESPSAPPREFSTRAVKFADYGVPQSSPLSSSSSTASNVATQRTPLAPDFGSPENTGGEAAPKMPTTTQKESLSRETSGVANLQESEKNTTLEAPASTPPASPKKGRLRGMSVTIKNLVS